MGALFPNLMCFNPSYVEMAAETGHTVLISMAIRAINEHVANFFINSFFWHCVVDKISFIHLTINYALENISESQIRL